MKSKAFPAAMLAALFGFSVLASLPGMASAGNCAPTDFAIKTAAVAVLRIPENRITAIPEKDFSLDADGKRCSGKAVVEIDGDKTKTLNNLNVTAPK